MSDVRHQTDIGSELSPEGLLKTAVIPGDPPVLQVEGEIDILTAGALRTALDEATSLDGRVVVDMAGVTFFDASGLRVLLKVAAARQDVGPLTLLNAPRVARVLELVGLHECPWIVLRDEVESVGG